MGEDVYHTCFVSSCVALVWCLRLWAKDHVLNYNFSLNCWLSRPVHIANLPTAICIESITRVAGRQVELTVRGVHPLVLATALT